MLLIRNTPEIKPIRNTENKEMKKDVSDKYQLSN